MSERHAAGRKTELPVTDMVDVLGRLAEEMRTALARSGDGTSDTYDSRGRLRDHEIAIAAKLGTMSAQIAGVLVRLEQLKER